MKKEEFGGWVVVGDGEDKIEYEWPMYFGGKKEFDVFVG